MCHSCLECKPKSSISAPNETQYLEYVTASRREKKETTSQTIKMIISMEGDDLIMLQHTIQRLINEKTDVISNQVTSIEIVEEGLKTRRKRDTDAKIIQVALIVFIKLKGRDHPEVSIPEFEADLLAYGFIKSLKIIPLTEESLIYFITQQIVLILTVFVCILGAVKRYKSIKSTNTDENAGLNSNVKKSENMIQFGLIVFVHFFLPILDMVPSVYVWYDYNTSKNLAYDRTRTMSTMLFGFTFLKLVFFMIRIMMLNAEFDEDVMFGSRRRHKFAKKLLFGGVSGGILQFLCVDSLKPLLIYFYFNRYLNPGENVSAAAFGCFILILIKHIHSIIYYLIKFVSKVFCNRCADCLSDYNSIKIVTAIETSDENLPKLMAVCETLVYFLRYVIKVST